jgi:hypothetical protein
MRLLLDEDSQSRLLIRLLTEAGHDVLTVGDADLIGHSDAEVLKCAMQHDRTLLTRNVDDFLALHEEEAVHPGISAEYEYREPAKNTSAVRIVQAVANLESSGCDIAGQFIALNAWNFDPPSSI